MSKLKQIQFFQILLVFAAIPTLLPALAHAEPGDTHTLWYDSPAEVWTEALPVGNGSLGGMVYGTPEKEHIQFNEDTLWGGTVHDYQHSGASKHLDEIRNLLWQGKQKEAEALAMENFMSVPLRQMKYKAFGDLYLQFPGHEQYRDYYRELDLSQGVARVKYRVDDSVYRRETFSSYPDNVLVQRMEVTEGPGRINGKIFLESPHALSEVTVSGDNELLLTGRVQEDDGLTFASRVRIYTEGGKISKQGDLIRIKDAKSLTLHLNADTSYKNFRDISGNPERNTRKALDRVAKKSYDALRDAHIEDHSNLYDRVTLDLGDSAMDDLPIDERLQRDEKTDDPELAALLYHYGRYLLIASSRPGSQPANLQGIWNKELEPSWGSKYTLNINAEMNYWPTEVANLEETAEPLFDMIDDLVISGSKTAKVHYDAPGWVVHHNTDLWRGSAPINHANHGIWPGGSAWLSQHLWQRWLYSQDKDFLRERAYPVMKEAAEFYADYMVEDPHTGWLISGPSNSPETGGLVMAPTMDHQLIRSLFGWVIEASNILDTDQDFAQKLKTMRAKIAPNQLGRLGQLQEWLEDVDDPANDHRHVSHLWGVFPGDDITWHDPEMMNAAKTSLLLRGDGGTGWALAWKLNLWARFLDGDHAHKMLMKQLNLVHSQHSGPGGVYPNMFDAHPPFQIDGNFGATAGISELLMQSHTNEIEILPALPSAWPEGSVEGIRARGAFELAFSWEDGELKHLRITAEKEGRARLRYEERATDIDLKAGESAEFGPGLREMKPYKGDKSPLELAEWMMESQVSRFQEWLPEGEEVPGRWSYSLGMLAVGFVEFHEQTGNERSMDLAHQLIDPCLNPDGSIDGYEMDDYNIDNIKPGSAVLELYEHTGKDIYRGAADTLREQLEKHPRTSEGGFWHKERYPHQMWLDGLFMGSPFFAQYGKLFDEPSAFEDVIDQIVLMDKYAYDHDHRLYFHAWDESGEQPWSDPVTGLSDNFWSRAIGWYAMALVDVLDFIPEDHPRRDEVLNILEKCISGVVRWQDHDNGLWWQVTDERGRPGNYLESTASAMFIYSLAKGINEGYLDAEQYTDPLNTAWNGLQEHLLDVDAKGRISLAQCCQVAGLSDDRDGSYEYYLSERIVTNDIKGVAPFVRACLELAELRRDDAFAISTEGGHSCPPEYRRTGGQCSVIAGLRWDFVQGRHSPEITLHLGSQVISNGGNDRAFPSNGELNSYTK